MGKSAGLKWNQADTGNEHPNVQSEKLISGIKSESRSVLHQWPSAWGIVKVVVVKDE